MTSTKNSPAFLAVQPKKQVHPEAHASPGTPAFILLYFSSVAGPSLCRYSRKLYRPAKGSTGCGTQQIFRALGGTHISLTTAPTTPPCFGHWPRSSPLQTKGCSPLVTPKLLGSIQKIQAAPLKDFLCSADFESLARRAVRASLCSVCCANASAGSRRCKMPLPATTLSREN